MQAVYELVQSEHEVIAGLVIEMWLPTLAQKSIMLVH